MKKNKTIKGWILFTLFLFVWIILIHINFNNIQKSWAVIWLIFGSPLYWLIYFFVDSAIIDKKTEIDEIREISETITDIDGNIYHTIKIGTQVWMVENLNVSHFRNGEIIPEAKTAEEWKEAGNKKQPAWCYYNNNPDNGKIFGKLFNWYAVNDSRGLAPLCCHIPSDKEWTTLTDYLGGELVAGGKLKETSLTHWQPLNREATNESGFTALPGSYRNDNGAFGVSIGCSGYWWSSTKDVASYAWGRGLLCYGAGVYRGNFGKCGGFSLRCLKGKKPSKLSVFLQKVINDFKSLNSKLNFKKTIILISITVSLFIQITDISNFDFAFVLLAPIILLVIPFLFVVLAYYSLALLGLEDLNKMWFTKCIFLFSVLIWLSLIILMIINAFKGNKYFIYDIVVYILKYISIHSY
ncbi:MAG TPA: fibrobacter succinogenes major paralogous domain-containing protein [Bacteroidales bacterium]|nr:fibrobacter succinogenes major paralogous domain-containing protein [Bacteroidales bacterium]HPS17819.1 fibrobacter succinogenes major paralogous domain-containing protein [Bacteroidales bacterium]